MKLDNNKIWFFILQNLNIFPSNGGQVLGTVSSTVCRGLDCNEH